MNRVGIALAVLLVSLGSGAHAQTVPAAQAALDGLDTRRPLPLLPMMADHQKQNMRENLIVVQGIIAALGTGDFKAIERTAARIGYSQQMQSMCENMGGAAPGFTHQALAFHRSVDHIVAAARAHDRARVLDALDTTLKHCTGCHATWKQQIVDEPTWNRLAAAAAQAPRTSAGHD